jgi:hypothetical protein
MFWTWIQEGGDAVAHAMYFNPQLTAFVQVLGIGELPIAEGFPYSFSIMRMHAHRRVAGPWAPRAKPLARTQYQLRGYSTPWEVSSRRLINGKTASSRLMNYRQLTKSTAGDGEMPTTPNQLVEDDSTSNTSSVVAVEDDGVQAR